VTVLWMAVAIVAIVGVGALAITPTPRAGIILTAILVAAIAVPISLIILAALVLAGCFLADVAFVTRRPIAIRAVPSLLIRGAAAPLGVTVETATAGRVRIRQPRAAELAIDPPEADTELVASVTAARRGRHTLPPIALRITGPLGLAARYRRGDDPAEIVVFPDVLRARHIAAAIRRGLFRDAGELTRGPLGLGTDFESIRDYLPDDDIRQVNWPATQRQGRPMSNQYRVEQDRTIIGLVDCGRLMAAPVDDRTRLDAALDALVAVAHAADELGDRAGVIAFADSIQREVRPRRRGADAIVQAVYDLEPTRTDAAYDLAFRAVGGGKRALVMVFTDLLDGAAAAELVEAVPVLARRHVVVVAAVSDPDLERYLSDAPTVVTDVYRAAAAHDLLSTRDSVIRQLRHAGATVVDARPDAFTDACVGAYLRSKRTARL